MNMYCTIDIILPHDLVMDPGIRFHLQNLRFDGGDLHDLLDLLGVEVAQTQGLHKTWNINNYCKFAF